MKSMLIKKQICSTGLVSNITLLFHTEIAITQLAINSALKHETARFSVF